MEFSLSSFDSALPVEITIDDDNGRYMIRKSDTSGEIFNTPKELIDWVRLNLQEEEFCDRNKFIEMMEILKKYEYGSMII